MSDDMLHAVLRMPPHLWTNDYLDQVQRHQRYLEASNKIQSMESVVAAADRVYYRYKEEEDIFKLFDAVNRLNECVSVYRSGLR